ncbi:hypothetical protein GC176_27530 [bacterium]|nr:hypothetical protein [bacterium]
MKNLLTTSVATLAMTAFVLSGCADSTTSEPASSRSSVASGDHHEGDGHDHSEASHEHPSEGPHGGDLIELGNEEYHAELVHPYHHDDNAHAHADHKDGDDHKGGHEEHGDPDHEGVTIYILDGSAKESVAIDVAEITLNLSHDGKPEQFKLTALPTETDPEGKSSRFASDDNDLLEHFHEEEIEGTLVLQINGKSYRGKVAHNHEDHGHDHHEH